MQSLKLLLILSLTFTLSSCYWDKPSKDNMPQWGKNAVNTVKIPDQTGATMTAPKTPEAINCTPVTPMDTAALKIWESGMNPTAWADAVSSGKIVFVNYTLRTCTQDGKILDTSREADAKIGNIFTQGRTYEPLQTVIGEHKVIRGFEYGLIGMKKGEKKIIAVAPIDGYGVEDAKGGSKEERVPKYAIAPEYTLTLDKSLFADTVTQTIKKTLLGDKTKNLKVGQTLTGGQNNDIPAKVIKITNDEVTLEIDNSSNPFHGKKLKPGVSSSVEEGNEFTIVSMEGTGITFNVINKKSPFYKKYTVGAVADVPVGQITLKSIEKDDLIIVLDQGKDPKKTSLFFDVEVIDIK